MKREDRIKEIGMRAIKEMLEYGMSESDIEKIIKYSLAQTLVEAKCEKDEVELEKFLNKLREDGIWPTEQEGFCKGMKNTFLPKPFGLTAATNVRMIF